MGAGDPLYDRKSESCSVLHCAVSRFEHSRSVFRFDSPSVVGDEHPDLIAILKSTNADLCRVAAVFYRIPEEVLEEPFGPISIGSDRRERIRDDEMNSIRIDALPSVFDDRS